ncbi:MAG: TonB-dependent receptor domain-containing protein [Syntrophothermus sp.]
MKKNLLIILFCLLAAPEIFSQSDIKVFVKDKTSDSPLSEVNVLISGTKLGASTDSAGYAEVHKIPAGDREIAFSLVGYRKQSYQASFPAETGKTIVVYMEESEESLKDVIISTSRVSRSLEDIPVRIEAVAAEELDEKLSVRVSDITQLLSEVNGIQVQQNSLLSGASSVRMLGLDGRYTQILKDGYPLYSGLSGGLSIIQIPPLDLNQVEVVKGSSSTLYGGGAIAGLINLISRTPHTRPEFNLLLNANSVNGVDGSSFYSARNEKTGISLLANLNKQKAFDFNGDNLAEIPETEAWSVSPRLFYYPDNNSTLSLAVNQFHEKRKGGLIPYLNNPVDAAAFFEFNTSERLSTQLSYSVRTGGGDVVLVKNSLAYFGRSIERKNGFYEAKQFSTFTEASWLMPKGDDDLVIGLNFLTDRIKPENNLRPAYIFMGLAGELYDSYTGGVFIQYDMNVNEKLKIEPGLRLDYNNNEKTFLLPSFYAIYKFTPEFSTRIGGGAGYKLPYVFDENEDLLFSVVRTNEEGLKAEKSIGGGCDFTLKGKLTDELNYQLNQSFYLTVINNPLTAYVPPYDSPFPVYIYKNESEPYNARGSETSLSISAEDFKIFTGLHISDAKRKFNVIHPNIPLNPGFTFWTDIAWEEENNFRLAFEAYYTGKQYLEDGTETKDFWNLGILAVKQFSRYLNVFVNFENLTNTRMDKLVPQENYMNRILQSNEIWAPLEGFTVNGGIRIKI